MEPTKKQLRAHVGKKKFGDSATARAHSASAGKQYGGKFDAYRCAVCQWWHVGHSTPDYESPVLLAKLQQQARVIARDEISAMRKHLAELGAKMENEIKRELQEALEILGRV